MSDEAAADDEHPRLARGASFDQKLSSLIASVSTALDEYRRLAAEDDVDELPPEAGIVVSSNSTDAAIAKSEAFDLSLERARETVDQVTQPSSARADDLKRQLLDARGLNQLAAAEISMPVVMRGWLKKVVDALKTTPTIIKRTVAAMRVGTDVTEVLYGRWCEFADDGTKFLFAQFRKTLDAFEAAADILEKRPSVTATMEQVEEPLSPAEAANKRERHLQERVRDALGVLDMFDVGERIYRDDNAHNLEKQAIIEADLISLMHELAALDAYRNLTRRFTLDTPAADGGSPTTPATLGRAGHGLTQRVFERLVLIAMRQRQRPLQSGDVVDELRRLGVPIGGINEIKNAYNKLWQAKKRGVLQHVEGQGYWIAGTPVPISNALQTVGGRALRRIRSIGMRSKRTGNPRGRQAAIRPADLERIRKMLLSNKTVREVSAMLDVTTATIYKHFPGGVEKLREMYPDETVPLVRKKMRRVKRGPHRSGGGRPSSLSADQIVAVVAARNAGKTVEHIAEEFGVSTSIVYRHLRKAKAT
ncbi:helix-turn-helix domain-containing protein [Hyphomicrobium album]|uniref:helix-turn-helix domain-containing protein n=1 Tax=Hyphomicrobium album TaxID=2665159 RepID=UPI0018AA87C6|nr:helix-turn-helix domain-containing protein [Hyphomicrobium album]